MKKSKKFTVLKPMVVLSLAAILCFSALTGCSLEGGAEGPTLLDAIKDVKSVETSIMLEIQGTIDSGSTEHRSTTAARTAAASGS